MPNSYYFPHTKKVHKSQTTRVKIARITRAISGTVRRESHVREDKSKWGRHVPLWMDPVSVKRVVSTPLLVDERGCGARLIRSPRYAEMVLK